MNHIVYIRQLYPFKDQKN